MEADYGPLEQALGHRFSQRYLCEQALTHTSWVNENQGAGRADNERLEFLGDSVLSVVVSDMLMKMFPDAPEGRLSKARAGVVSEAGLAAVASDLDLGQWIFLGRGERGRRRRSIVADALEALVGAVFLDGGFSAAQTVVQGLFGPRLKDAEQIAHQDYKSRLQELSQARFKTAPAYEIVSQGGPEHDKTFGVALRIGEKMYPPAEGRTKKAAQQAAAQKALEILEGENAGSEPRPDDAGKDES